MGSWWVASAAISTKNAGARHAATEAAVAACLQDQTVPECPCVVVPQPAPATTGTCREPWQQTFRVHMGLGHAQQGLLSAWCLTGKLNPAALCAVVAALQPEGTILVDESLTSGGAYYELSKVM